MPRALRNSPLLRPGWDKWLRDAREPFPLGRLGYSYKAGKLRADMAPINGTWRAEIWRRYDRGAVLATIEDPNLWHLAEMVVAKCGELQTTR